MPSLNTAVYTRVILSLGIMFELVGLFLALPLSQLQVGGAPSARRILSRLSFIWISLGIFAFATALAVELSLFTIEAAIAVSGIMLVGIAGSVLAYWFHASR